MARSDALLLVIALVGCGVEGPEVAATSAPIRGGVDDTTDVAVVAVVDSMTNAKCTGALIAPDLVVSAQHCVAAVINIGPCTQGTFGPPRRAADFLVTTRPTITANIGDYRAATEIRLPPGGDRFCGRDIVLLRLASKVPPAEAAPIAPRLDPAPAAAEFYAAIGYGAVDDQGTDADRRRRRDGLKVNCVGAACASTFLDADAEWLGEAGPCVGDSGGPAVDGAGRVIGISSRGAVGCFNPVYGTVAAHADWLVAEAQRAAALGGYPPPAWAGAAPPIDAGVDAAPDRDGPIDVVDDDDDGGCCSTGRGRPAPTSLLAVLVLASLRRRRGAIVSRR